MIVLHQGPKSPGQSGFSVFGITWVGAGTATVPSQEFLILLNHMFDRTQN